MELRQSRVLRKLRAGGIVSCFKTNLSCARAAEIAAMAGFDCVWADMEHVATDWSVVEKMVWATKTRDTDLMVRVARGGYSDHIIPLELDASGIMVPHVMSLADAKQVVRMTRFHPIGRRPLDGGNADGAYCQIPTADYIRQANDQRFVMIQIEDPEPLDDLDAIAALPGIDIILFGMGDFSQGIGSPGQFDDPIIAQTRKRIAEVCRKHGKYAGAVGSPQNFSDLVGLGYRFISMGADVVGLSRYCKGLVDEFDRLQASASMNVEETT